MFDMIPYRRNNKLYLRGDSLLNQFFDEFFTMDLVDPFISNTSSFKVDVKENETNYMVQADLPGIEKEAINLTYDDNYLTINAKKQNEVEENENSYVRQERYYGEFTRKFYINNIDENNIEASFTNGVLNIVLPKTTNDEDNSKKIEIQ